MVALNDTVPLFPKSIAGFIQIYLFFCHKMMSVSPVFNEFATTKYNRPVAQLFVVNKKQLH